MGRKRVPIFPLFEEVQRVTASLSDEQMGKAIRYALACYYGRKTDSEPDALTKLAATMMLDQAARYDSFRERQRNNALNPRSGGEPSAANVSQMLPNIATESEAQPSDPPSPSPNPLNNICSKAVELLNSLSGSSFRSSTKTTQRLVSAREKDGYSLADIELVIRHQCRLWGNDEKMRKFLRPETLFGSKFEAYLSDARRSEPHQESGYTLAPLEDPWELAIKEGYHA